MGILFTALIVAAVIVVGLIAFAVLMRSIKIAKPDEAIIVTSKQKRGDASVQASQRVVIGSRTFVKPFVESASKLSLASRQLNVTSTAQTKNFVTIKVDAVANVKVGGDIEMVRVAAQRYLGQQDQIDNATREILEGSVRAIIGELTVEEIITSRDTFRERAFNAVKDALDIQGLTIDTLQIKEIRDDNDYIRNLSRAEQARIRQQAELAETETKRQTESARIAADQAVADQQRELDLRIAAIRKETDKATAEAEQAAPLAKAQAEQAVIDAEAQAAERRVALRRKQTESEINVAADAEAYQTRTGAEAAAAARRTAAEADRDARVAAAQAIEAEGAAEAARIRAIGEAEAEATQKKAEALRDQSQALLQQQLIEKLPEIVKAAADPVSAISNLTIIGGSDDPASGVTSTVAGNLASTTQIVKDLVGIDLGDLVNSAVLGSSAGRAIAAAVPAPQPKLAKVAETKPAAEPETSGQPSESTDS